MKWWLAAALLLMWCGSAAAEPLCGPDTKQGELCLCRVDELHPTQMTVGKKELEARIPAIVAKSGHDLATYEKKHSEPVVRGPGGTLFITDHHHLLRILWDLRLDYTYCRIEKDYANLSVAAFWKQMDEQKLVYPVDAEGVRHSWRDLPRNIGEVGDDPYRSLAGFVHYRCGFGESEEPFAEFRWGEYFRRLVPRELVEKDFDAAVAKGIELARSEEAKSLPGWCGERCRCSE